MKRIAIIGGGVSGLTCAQLLKDRYEVVVFEKELKPGGLIRCENVNGSLFHICGGHVFNTKNEKVNDWFWRLFDKDRDFVKAKRNSAVYMDDGRFVSYPIENHVYQLDEDTQKGFYRDLQEMIKNKYPPPHNFEEFLISRFGRTLYDLYFGPYNRKIWRQDLRDIPLSWLEGKLPMPTPEEMLEANRSKLEETSFVHSSFYYPKEGGSQFIADTLARGIDVKYGQAVSEVIYRDGMITLRFLGGAETFNYCIFCGNITELPRMLDGVDLGQIANEVNNFKAHGTTSVFCETDSIPYSWFYQPSASHQSHRFICTGNFSPKNNAPGKMACTVEFTDEIGVDEIKQQLQLMPYNPKYLTHHYSKFTYPVQSGDTRDIVSAAKDKLAHCNIGLVGRFAEWEYFNMDAAMSSAMKLCSRVHV